MLFFKYKKAWIFKWTIEPEKILEADKGYIIIEKQNNFETLQKAKFINNGTIEEYKVPQIFKYDTLKSYFIQPNKLFIK